MANHLDEAKQSAMTREQCLQAISDAKEQIAAYAAGNMMEPLLAMPLTIQQLRILGLLYVEPEHNTGAQLAERLSISLATMSGLLDRLSALEMLQRQEDPADQRVRRITLTTTGQEVIQEFFDANERLTDQLLAELATPDLQALATGVKALAQVMARQPRP